MPAAPLPTRFVPDRFTRWLLLWIALALSVGAGSTLRLATRAQPPAVAAPSASTFPTPAPGTSSGRVAASGATHRVDPGADARGAAPAPVQGQPAPVAGEVQPVWVNTKSGIYHLPGTRWYGNTQAGRFMAEDEAQAAGHRAALNHQ